MHRAQSSPGVPHYVGAPARRPARVRLSGCVGPHQMHPTSMRCTLGLAIIRNPLPPSHFECLALAASRVNAQTTDRRPKRPIGIPVGRWPIRSRRRALFRSALRHRRTKNPPAVCELELLLGIIRHERLRQVAHPNRCVRGRHLALRRRAARASAAAPPNVRNARPRPVRSARSAPRTAISGTTAVTRKQDGPPGKATGSVHYGDGSDRPAHGGQGPTDQFSRWRDRCCEKAP